MAEYKIKDIEVLTGVKSHTIRIWEKRYGILLPERTASKIRRYSEEDLALLLRISVLNQHGLKISKIAKLSDRELKEQIKKIGFSKDSKNSVLSVLITALLDFDDDLFKRVLNDVVSKEGLKTAYFNYILPFLDRIGIMWLVGTISPTQEHFISNLIREIVIVETHKLPEPIGDKNYALFCIEGDWHELSLLLYNYLLREKGERTYYLGQNLPLNAVGEIIKKIKVDVFISSIITSLDEKIAADFVRFAEEINQPVYIGGAQSLPLINKYSKLDLFKDVKELFQ